MANTPETQNRPRQKSENEVWDPVLLEWVAMQQPILNAGSVTVSNTVSGDMNLTKLDGTTVSVGEGPQDAGTLRVFIADDNFPIVRLSVETLPVSLVTESIPVLHATTSNGPGDSVSVAGCSAGIFELDVLFGHDGGAIVGFYGLDNDGDPTIPLTCRNIITNQFATSTSLAGQTFWEVNLAGLTQITMVVSSYSAGTIIGQFRATAAATSSNTYIANDYAKYVDLFDYDGGSNLVYFGQAGPGSSTSGALWQIRKFTYDGSGNPTSAGYANGTNAFTNTWTSRASYSYS